MRTINSAIITGTAIIYLMFGLSDGRAATVVNTADAGPGSLRAAVAGAAAGETIAFEIPASDPNCAGGVCTISLTGGTINVSVNLNVVGTGASSLVIRRAAGAATNFSVFRVAGSAVSLTVRNLTLSHGSGSSGGGINNAQGGIVWAMNVAFRSHTAVGGGIFNGSGGRVTVLSSTFSGNATTGSGAGIFNGNSGLLWVGGSIFNNNTAASNGGAINNTSGATAEIAGSTFTNNATTAAGGNGGGAVSNDNGGILRVADSIFTGNSCAGSGGCSGGALKNEGATAEISRSIFRSNSGSNPGGTSGGAVANDNGADLTVLNSTFDANACGGAGGASGGALKNDNASTAAISGSNFINNVADSSGGTSGGAVNNDNGSSMSITNSTFSGNRSTRGYGGAIMNDNDSDLNVSESTVSGNAAETFGRGGGIYTAGGSMSTLTNVTVSGNSATGTDAFGGGLGNGDGKPNLTLTNATVTGNFVSGSNAAGGGIYNAAAATVNPKNVILSGNSAPQPSAGADAFGDIASFGNNLVGATEGSAGWVGSDLQNNPNARLAPLASNGGATRTHALADGSAAIDAGTSTGAGSADQRGAARSGAVDIGAFESNAAYTAALPSGRSGQPYQLTLVGNTGNFVFAATGGSLPPGLDLTTATVPQAALTLAGTPSQTGTFNFQITGTDGARTTVNNYALAVLPPAASAVAVGGRVFAASGRFIGRAQIVLIDGQGTVRRATSSSFGYYRLTGVAVGETYLSMVFYKGYVFAPRLVTVADEMTDLDFTAEANFFE